MSSRNKDHDTRRRLQRLQAITQEIERLLDEACEIAPTARDTAAGLKRWLRGPRWPLMSVDPTILGAGCDLIDPGREIDPHYAGAEAIIAEFMEFEGTVPEFVMATVAGEAANKLAAADLPPSAPRASLGKRMPN